MTMNTRYLQSRFTIGAIVWMSGLSLVAWALLRATSEPCLALLIKTIAPLGVAVLIGLGARSPFGEVEAAVGSPLARLRLMHFLGLLSCASVVFILAGSAEPGQDAVLMMIRNVAGFTGLALLAGAVIGSASGWLIPFAYGLVASLAAMPDNRVGAWAWPARPADHVPSAIAAGLLLLAGLAVAIRNGAKEESVSPHS